MTCIITPGGRHAVPPMTAGEGILIADLDMRLITKRKRMMDRVGHCARPELLRLLHNTRAALSTESWAAPDILAVKEATDA